MLRSVLELRPQGILYTSFVHEKRKYALGNPYLMINA